jgi:predicted metal-dependent hydrolase
VPAENEHPGLPAYQVRESARARHVRLHVSPADGVVVVVPRGFDQALLPALLDRRRAWLAHAQSRFQTASAHWHEGLPSRLELLAPGQAWRVEYRLSTDPSTSLRVNPSTSLRVNPSTSLPSLRLRSGQAALLRAGAPVRLEQPADGCLRLSGAIHQADACREILRDWLAEQAKTWLPPQLAELSAATRLPYQQLRIKKLRSRWGSCSARGNLNLSYKLLFLPPELARYVLLHELCHTVHLDHSPRFWGLLESLAPGSRELDKTMRHAWQYVPRWVET